MVNKKRLKFGIVYSIAFFSLGIFVFFGIAPSKVHATTPDIYLVRVQSQVDTMTLKALGGDVDGVDYITIYVDLDQDNFFADPGETKTCNSNICIFDIGGFTPGQTREYYAIIYDKIGNFNSTLPVRSFTVQPAQKGFTVGPIKPQIVAEGASTQFEADIVVGGSNDVVSCGLVVDGVNVGGMVDKATGVPFTATPCAPGNTCTAIYNPGYTFGAGTAGKEHAAGAHCADDFTPNYEDLFPTSVSVKLANGATCSSNGECQSNFCDPGTSQCAAPAISSKPEVQITSCTFAADKKTATITPQLISGTPVYYGWKFGDGNSYPNAPDSSPPALVPGDPQPVTHQYAQPGKYTVRLTAIEDDGDWHQASWVCNSLTTTVTKQDSPFSEKTIFKAITTATLPDLINILITFILFLATPILILLLIWAGVVLMVTGSNPQQRLSAVRLVQYAIIGYAIILLAKVILAVITGILF